MKILICPDKFKGSLSAKEVCEAIEKGIIEVFPEAKTTSIPMADGGEGTLDILEAALGLERVSVTVPDPLFRPVQAWYGRKGVAAFIEMALASGLQLLAPEERSAAHTSSVGTGTLIKHAISQGATTIHLFVGGSATNDGGAGIVHSLGFRFLDAEGQELSPIGANLGNIQSIVSPDQSFPDMDIQLITDVTNPLLGSNGATRQYGPQKGATAEELEALEMGMTHFAQFMQQQAGSNLASQPGSGAAGGVAVCLLGLLKGQLRRGMVTLLDITGLTEQMGSADLVITGEGKMDEQTLQGKVVHGIARAGQAVGVPVTAICGINQLQPSETEALGLAAIASLKTPELSAEFCMENASDLIRARVVEMLRGFASDSA